MEFWEFEAEHGVTVNAANISLVYNYNNQDYLINLIDTPGHIDFGGEVIRAMRAIDGVIIVVDAAEGVMPQTETVIREALREDVKPVLFINKVDRLISELKFTGEQIQERFVKLITEVNRLIAKNAPEQFRESWQVNPEKGSVAFGSAKRKWAVSVPQLKKTGINMKRVTELMQQEKQDELAKISPLHMAVNEMVISHVPNPLEAQKYKVGKIWKGDPSSEIGQSMTSCNENGKIVMMVTDISVDPHAQDIATGRIFSGTLEKGKEVYLIGGKKKAKISQVGVYMGPDRVALEKVYAGNIGAIVGMKEAFAGETIAEEQIEPFEEFLTKVEPVITMAVEAKNMKDLPKLIEVLRQISKEDPNVQTVINQETGEHLVSGMGEYHLEVTKYRIEHDHGLPVVTSPPIVVYKESVAGKSESVWGKSPNKHNKFLVRVEPVEPKITQAIIDGELREGKEKNKDKQRERVEKLVECGMSRDEAKGVEEIFQQNILVDMTKGVQYLDETKELIIQAFEESMTDGVLCREKSRGVKVILEDASLHEDAVHRGPSQTLPAVKRPIYASILLAEPKILEPVQKIFITVPQDYLNAVLRELQQRRATTEDITNEGDQSTVKAVAPVKEMLGFASSIRSVTQGRALWTYEPGGFQTLPRSLETQVITEVRKRKGLPGEVPKVNDFLD